MNTDHLNPLQKELLHHIIDLCQVADEDLPETISPDDYLIGNHSVLGLDSLDAVEIVVGIQKAYSVTFGPMQKSHNTLKSLRTLSTFVETQKG